MDATVAASQIGELPRRLARMLTGDLDNIAARALKEPLERYQTVAAFADDLRRFLNHQPVWARADSFAYRASRLNFDAIGSPLAPRPR